MIAAALADLTPEHRAVAVLRYYAHLGLGDLAVTHAPDIAGLGEHR